MNKRVEGLRPRPRVAIVGSFDDEVLNRLGRLFPTTWLAGDWGDLDDQVDFREVDLVVTGPDTTVHVKSTGHGGGYLKNAHVISFSADIYYLPGPYPHTLVETEGAVTTEEYVLPPLPLPFHRRREADFDGVSSVRGWTKLVLAYDQPRGPMENIEWVNSNETFMDGAIVLDHHEEHPLAVKYWRKDSGLGVACLPQPVFSQYEWIELIAMDWAKSDRERFPGFGDWTKSPEWMLPEELALASQIDSLEDQRRVAVSQIDDEINRLSQELTRAGLAANQGRRQLLTACGNELVEEVASLFADIGFEVENVDDILQADEPRREDLRLRIPNEDAGIWEAIVEVRGYAKSAGKTSDLSRLGRFADLYQQEKGRLPEKRVYIVNGQCEIHNPSHREEPLASAVDDVDVFAERGGVVISTIDLYRLAKCLDRCDVTQARDSIKNAVGRWSFEPPDTDMQGN